jgi:hypothetical protein
MFVGNLLPSSGRGRARIASNQRKICSVCNGMSLALLLFDLNLARRSNMKKTILALALLIGLTQSGCAFLGGAAVGSLATGAGYEINAHSQMEKLEADYRNERISRREYEARKAQIEKGSILY